MEEVDHQRMGSGGARDTPQLKAVKTEAPQQEMCDDGVAVGMDALAMVGLPRHTPPPLINPRGQ